MRIGAGRIVLFALATLAGASAAQENGVATPDAGTPFAALALTQDEREECLALALARAMTGDCEAGLAWMDAAVGAGTGDELGRRVALERTRLKAWMAERDAFLAELAQRKKPLTLELDGKKVSTTFTREGDELLLAKGPKPRVSVRALVPEALVAAMPKERFAGANEWLKIYPYCVTANAKWKKLTTTEAASAELKRDAEEFYPQLARLAPLASALTHLAERPAPADAAAAREALAEIEALLALGRDERALRARLAALSVLARGLLVQVAESLELAELVHATVTVSADGIPKLAYPSGDENQAADWRADPDYLGGLRTPLEPVSAGEKDTPFAPGPQGFAGTGEFCWRHQLEFLAPLRVRYQVRWEPYEGKPNKAFAFALGILADDDERHVRVNELGYLYVDELDGPYTAVRPKGDATVQLGRTYALELVHDGKKAEVWVDGVLRAQVDAPARKVGRLFLWGHSDLRISVPALEIEGRVTPAALAERRTDWVRAKLGALGLAQEK